MKKLAIVLIPAFYLLSSFGPTAINENHNYDVFIDGRPIGTYQVDKTELNGTENFRVETNTAAGLIRRDEHRFVMLSSYDDSKLIASDLKSWMNDRLESSSLIHWDGMQYVKQTGDDLRAIYESQISYSSACMFFEEPVGRTSLFYEKYGKNLEVTDLGGHRYEVTLPNGGKERYSYFDGEVMTVEFVQSFATITLRFKS
ncbi:MAG: hypothetical protein QF371_03000 [Flavobacteriales bacterium]|jgi:hypothetical protein|nr:hypothetical protein [Flavobacteriales bacterium]